MKQAVLILAHGSRDAGARAEYRRLVDTLAPRLPNTPLELSVLEFAGDELPSIREGLGRCASHGVQRVVALPYFLFSAGHVREDLPTELRQAAAEWPNLEVAYQPSLGVDPRILDALDSRAAEAAQALSGQPAGSTALLLVGAGTSDAEANADLYRAARLLWERRGYELVEVSFVSLTEPAISEAVGRCCALGATRIVAVPYFLNTGVLSRRIAARLETCRGERPDIEIVLAAEIGLHPAVIDLLVERAQSALESLAAGYELPPCAEHGQVWGCWLRRAEVSK